MKNIFLALLFAVVASITFAQVPGGPAAPAPPKDGSVPNNNSTVPPADIPAEPSPNQHYPGQDPNYPDQGNPNNPTYNNNPKHYGSTGKTPDERADALTQRMKRELTLTTAQSEKISQLNRNKMRALKQTKDRYSNNASTRTQESKKIRQEWEADLRTILTPSQWKRYQSNRDELLRKEKAERAKLPKQQGNTKSAEEIEEEIEDEIEGQD